MPHNIFRKDWHLLTLDKAQRMVQTEFNVTVLPNSQLIQKLARLKIATLELIEIRTHSIAYRIRQTDEIFLINDIGECQVYSSQLYFDSFKTDILIESIKQKDVVFKGQLADNNEVIISYLKQPAFSMVFKENQLKNIIWENEKPEKDVIFKLEKKAISFFNAYFITVNQ